MTALSSTAAELAERVVERARGGDEAAFAALVSHYDAGLRALAYRLLGDRDRMDDALQEAYLKAYRALPRFRGESRLGTWLYRIAYNACLDELRRARAREVPLDGDREAPAPDPHPGESVPRRQALEQALAQLPPDDRAAVVLVDAQGFGYGEAAAVLGVPEGTVGSRLSRARAALRLALVEAEGGPSR